MFYVILKNGTTFAFNDECNGIDYESDNFIVFKKVINGNSYITLAVIPRENILYIFNAAEVQ